MLGYTQVGNGAERRLSNFGACVSQKCCRTGVEDMDQLPMR